MTNYFAHETAVIDEGCEIGDGVKIWHFSHVMPGSKIGDGCNLGQNVVVSPEVVLGKNVKVQNNVSIYTGVICEDDVFLGPSMVFTNVINPRSGINRKNQYARTLVKKGASIGANSTIVCGNDIGEFAFVGAGCVVTKDVPAYALVVGNPSKQIGWMSEFGHRLDFDEEGEAVCPESGETYLLLTELFQSEQTHEELFADRCCGLYRTAPHESHKETGNNLVAAFDPFDSVGVLDSYFPNADFFVEFERFDRHVEKLKESGINIDYVSVCSPNYLHDAHIRFGLRHGADVICEKPIVLNPWNVDALEEIESETDKEYLQHSSAEASPVGHRA